VIPDKLAPTHRRSARFSAQEYLRYRVNACGDLEAQHKVFAQIDGRGIQPTCDSACTFTVSPSSGTFGPGDQGSFQVTTNRDTCVCLRAIT
jgi:hypothetical protein